MAEVLFKSNARTFRNLLPGLLWTVVIFGLSVMPAVNLPDSWSDLLTWDKLAHAFVYAVQTCLLLLGLRYAGHLNAGPILIVLVFSITFGALMEVVQWAFFPGRYFEFTDIIANVIGSFIGYAMHQSKRIF